MISEKQNKILAFQYSNYEALICDGAVRSARTSYTSAQNSGRLDSFERFERAGIKVLKEWMSTKDERTRESHAQLNGVRVAVKEKFPNGLLYPGDPEGSPSEVYNCRCKLVSFFPGSSRDRGLGNTVETYEKWLKDKEADRLERLKNEETRAKASIEILKEKVDKEGISLKINPEKQAPHMEETRVSGKSYFTISSDELQEIIYNNYAKGKVRVYPNGQIKETIILPNEIGYDVSNIDGEETKTNAITIHYSKKRTHAVPTRRKK